MKRDLLASEAHEPAPRTRSWKQALISQETDLKASWQRCQQAGLKHSDYPEIKTVRDDELRHLQVEQARVRALAITEMRLLYRQLQHRGFALAFANHECVILDRLPGMRESYSSQRSDELAPGNCWPEGCRGTNALGTAAQTLRPTVVVNREHFLRAYWNLVCIAIPLFNPEGRLAGVLDTTVHGKLSRQAMAHVLGLMRMSVDHVESALFKEEHRHNIVLQIDPVTPGPEQGTIALAFDEKGYLETANRAAETAFRRLGIQMGTHFDELFRNDFRSLQRRAQWPVDFTQLSGHGGHTFAATVYLPTRTASLVNAPRSKSTERTSQPKSVEPPFIHKDVTVATAIRNVAKAVRIGAPILILGETGTGKELLAHYAHQVSERTGEFVAVNCAAIPENLIEAELFGYQAGAFTGARSRGAKGLVRQADGGTLFLDEIGDMPYELQGRLLRLLDSWRVRPVGSEHDFPVDVQLMAATNCDLADCVRQGRFREDLLHRIKVVEVRLPPLRERSDFDEMVTSTLAQIEPGSRLKEGAIEALRRYAWPGNMRELRNVLTRLIIRCDHAAITSSFVLSEFDLGKSGTEPGACEANLASQYEQTKETAVMDTYRLCGGNIAETARRLGISRTTVYKHLRRTRQSGS